MSNDGILHKDSEHGNVGSHPARPVAPLVVAPTTAAEFNTLSLPLPAVACLKLADILFEFDSSFVLPAVAKILSDLAGLREQHKNKKNDLPPLGVFGHADPVGEDEYNKRLSGRRAKAIYGLLAHELALWKSLANNPAGGDNWADKKTVDTMKQFLGPTAPSGEDALLTAYMAALFPNALPKSAFLAQGKGVKGKGDFQGCSRFNPLLTLAMSDDANLPHSERNAQNEINRRVVIFLFRPGSKIDPTLWPCPNADEPTTGCRLQFFVTPPKGDDRRRLGSKKREHKDLIDTPGDTFACRFYDEISHLSPCEGGGVVALFGGHIYANFDRVEGGQNVDKNEDRRKLRILRPGAIVIPNLDIDEDPAKTRKRFATDELDALVDEKINDGDDLQEVTLFKVAEPAVVQGSAARVVLQVDPADAKRIRIWQVPKGKTLKEGVVVIGPKQGNRFVVEDRLKAKPQPGWEHDFFIEALTFGGDVLPLPGGADLPAPNALSPPPPGEFRTPKPDDKGGSELIQANNSDTDKPVYATDKRHEDNDKAARAAGDVWIELIHEGPGDKQMRDVGLMTIAPWLMIWNTLPCQRVYVVNAERERPLTFQEVLSLENHSTVWELQRACFIGGVCLPPDPDTRIPIRNADSEAIRSLGDATFYALDGFKTRRDKNIRGNDLFIQDQFEIGYCFAPHRSLHVALHNKRQQSGMITWFLNEFAHADLGVYNGLSVLQKHGKNLEIILQEFDGVDFGGNLEVSPPIADATPAIPVDAAGPSVKAHRKAPFGKILLGDSKDRKCAPDFKNFLVAQKVQPVLPLDTSWLSVGHVDEFLSIVASNNKKGFKIPFANTRAMATILQETLDEDRDTTMHAGCYNNIGPGKFEYAETSVELFLLQNLRLSSLIQIDRLDFLQSRVRIGLALDPEDIIPIPMFFKELPDPTGENPEPKNVASSVGVVNMLVVNNTLAVPQPFGPRMTTDQASRVLRKSLTAIFGSAAPVVNLPSPAEHFFWARPKESLKAIAMYFVRPPLDPKAAGQVRRDLITRLLNLSHKNFDPKDPNFDLTPLGPGVKKAVDDLVKAILAANIGSGVLPSVGGILANLDIVPSPFGNDHTFTEWMRIRIPIDTVDVLEGYLKSVLEPEGNKVEFIPAYEALHENFGEIHCGTNAVRQQPELQSGFSARWWDPGVYDPDFDANYKRSG